MAIPIPAARKVMEESQESVLEALEKVHDEKIMRKQELKRQIESTKQRLEMMKKEFKEEKLKTYNDVIEKYNSLRDEYNALLAEKSRKSK
ncbi:uveal autoantigen with coiled-coil domains and ankyrin repeats [Senna tora]|uniref:Uveal autoantigen with coiled-coil domains and ankyrin repeats n=1 Tax=Senna tora TaxID=362788 RepID=A0A834WXI6_9FABA|nr:uveal autoantigen with coiled-coil domains and ankyrin repeats [Senna tora]